MELERWGHAFCRYADDCNIYVRTRSSAERVMTSISQFLKEQLKLRVNRDKSAVDRPWKRTFLGYGMTSHRSPRLKVSKKAVERLKAKVREIVRKARGRRLKRVIEEITPLLRGWSNYFKLSEVKKPFDELDGWLRRLSEERAWKSAQNGRGPWWNAGDSHMNEAFDTSYFTRLGLLSLRHQFHRFQYST